MKKRPINSLLREKFFPKKTKLHLRSMKFSVRMIKLSLKQGIIRLSVSPFDLVSWIGPRVHSQFELSREIL